MVRKTKVEVLEPVKNEVCVRQILVNDDGSDGKGLGSFVMGEFEFEKHEKWISVWMTIRDGENKVSLYEDSVDAMKVKLEAILGFVNTALAELDRL